MSCRASSVDRSVSSSSTNSAATPLLLEGLSKNSKTTSWRWPSETFGPTMLMSCRFFTQEPLHLKLISLARVSVLIRVLLTMEKTRWCDTSSITSLTGTTLTVWTWPQTKLTWRRRLWIPALFLPTSRWVYSALSALCGWPRCSCRPTSPSLRSAGRRGACISSSMGVFLGRGFSPCRGTARPLQMIAPGNETTLYIFTSISGDPRGYNGVGVRWG